MSTTQVTTEHITRTATDTKVDQKLEVIAIPVSDIDRAKRFYEGLGWRLDADFSGTEWRVVQLTPPGSPCSIQFGTGLTTAAPGSAQGTYLVVDNLEAARATLAARGAAISEVFHFASGRGSHVAGPDPNGRSYSSFVSFNDPDGNGWLVQEVTTRFPGRGFSPDVATMTELLRETETRHGAYEPTAPKHHWSAWYAAYIVARENGKSPDEAAQEGARRIESAR